jgi:hypothetical protein
VLKGICNPWCQPARQSRRLQFRKQISTNWDKFIIISTNWFPYNLPPPRGKNAVPACGLVLGQPLLPQQAKLGSFSHYCRSKQSLEASPTIAGGCKAWKLHPLCCKAKSPVGMARVRSSARVRLWVLPWVWVKPDAKGQVADIMKDDFWCMRIGW